MLVGRVVRLFLLSLVCFASLATPIINFVTVGHLKEFHSAGSASTAKSHQTHEHHHHDHSHTKIHSQEGKELINQTSVGSSLHTFNYEGHRHSFLELPAFLSVRNSEALAVVFVAAFFSFLVNLFFYLPFDFSRIYSFLKPMGSAPPPSKFRNLPLLN